MELPLTLELQFDTNDNNTSSVNPLKKKLVPSHQEEMIIPLKKIHLDSNVPESFFGLPDTVRNLIKKYKRIDKLYEWQEKCLNMSAMHERRNLIYAVPTSGGKTLVAEILMHKEIVCRRKNALFILPYVASVQEKIQLMKPFATELNFFIGEYYVDNDPSLPNKMGEKNSLSICTIEKAQGIINYLIELNRLDEIGIIVVDELHLLGESGGRGATLECLLTKVIHSESNVQIIGMSATIGNLKEIALFLNAKLYEDNHRPVGIKEYIKCGSKMWLIDSKEKNILTNEMIIEHKYTPEVLDRDPDFLGHLVLEIVPEDSCLVFCSTKKNCESIVTLLSDLVQRQVRLKSHKVNEKLALLNALKNENEQICPVLQETIPFGFAYHHSGLTSEERRLIEEAFRSGVLCVICCTSTLATGVNLPARRVIIRSPYISNQFLNLSRYKQMIGRAGRAGLREVGESILVSSKKDFKKVLQLLSSKMDDSMSRLHKDKDRGIKNLITSAVLLSMGSTRADLHRLVSKTLLKVQEDRLLKSGITLEKVADEALVTLVKDGILVVKEDLTKSLPALHYKEVLEIQMDECEKLKQTGEVKVVKLTNNARLELCPLGKAAIKGLINLEAALALYQKLKTWIGVWKSKQNLDSEDQLLHLVSLITPCDIANQITVIENDHCDIILRLPESKMQVARLLGLNEVAMINIRRGTIKQPDFITVIKRFYVTLILHELSQQQSIHDVAKKYEVNHRTIKSLLSSASSFFSQVVRFCRELGEFQMFAIPLLEFARKLTHYGAAELELLTKLPFVQKGRATQLHKAEYSTLPSIATADPEDVSQDQIFIKGIGFTNHI